MNRMTDEKLEKLLADYYESEPPHTLTYRGKDAKKPAPIPFWSQKRFAAAASLVLVTALSIGIYFFFGNKANTPIPVAPSPQSVSPSAEGRGDGTEATEPSASAEAVSPTENSLLRNLRGSVVKPPETPSGVQPTQKSPSSVKPNTPQATEKAKQPGTAPQKPNVKPSPNSTEKPSPSATEPVHHPPKPVSPTSAPTTPVSPTHASETEPCDPPWNDDPDIPTEGGGSVPGPWYPEPTNAPDEPGIKPPGSVALYGVFNRSLLSADTEVYCRVYDDRGVLLGEQDLYASSHTAGIDRITDSAVYAVYTTPEGMIWRSGNYRYVFYDRFGTLLTQGQKYIEV